MADVELIREKAKGRWREIIGALGMPDQYLNGKNGPCPLCRTGRDRWRFMNHDGSGSWICTKCGHGSGVDLAMEVTGLGFKNVLSRIGEVLRMDPKPDPPRPKDVSKEAMERIWQAADWLTEGSPGWRYFHNRGLTPPKCLRYHPKVYYDRDKAGSAILAKVVGPDGRCANLYRTYINPDGTKAAMEKPKVMMRARVPVGSAVRLCPIAQTMGLAEGIENALAATSLFGIGCWAALGTAQMERFTPPEGVERLVVFSDNDVNYAGQKAAFTLAHRLWTANNLAVSVEVPKVAGTDWNDVLMESRG